MALLKSLIGRFLVLDGRLQLFDTLCASFPERSLTIYLNYDLVGSSFQIDSKEVIPAFCHPFLLMSGLLPVFIAGGMALATVRGRTWRSIPR